MTDHISAISNDAELERLNDELRRVAARATKLVDVTTALSEAPSVKAVTDVVLTTGLAVTQASGGVVIRGENDRLEVLGSRGYGPELLARIARDVDGPVIEAIRTRKPIWFASIAEVRRRFPRSLAREGDAGDLYSGCTIPLIYANETFGVLGLTFAHPRAFGATDRAFTVLLAQAAAAALHRALGYDSELEGRREAELLAQGREEVLGVVAHDLRNPLNLMAMSSQLLIEEAPTPERQKLLDIMTRAITQMTRLVNDLLDTWRLQAGHVSLNLETVRVRDIFDQAERPSGSRRQNETSTSRS